MNPAAGFIIASPSVEMAGNVWDVLSSHPDKPSRCELVVGETRQILRQARAAMVASGTATIEAALMDVRWLSSIRHPRSPISSAACS